VSDSDTSNAGPLPPRLALVAIALTAFSTVAAEVLLTRVLSVATWYGLVFIVLSLAMVGLAAGSLQALRARQAGIPPGPWCAARLVTLALGLAASVTVAAAVPLQLVVDLTSLGGVLLVSAAVAWPMAASGGIIARLLAETQVSASRLYAVDLLAAALGSLAPLVLVGPMSPQSVLLLLGIGLSLTGAALAPAQQRKQGLAAASLLAVLLAFAGADGHRFPIRTVKFPSSQPPIFERWNPLSLVTVAPFVTTPEPFMWGPPSRCRRDSSSGRWSASTAAPPRPFMRSRRLRTSSSFAST